MNFHGESNKTQSFESRYYFAPPNHSEAFWKKYLAFIYSSLNHNIMLAWRNDIMDMPNNTNDKIENIIGHQYSDMLKTTYKYYKCL